MSDVRAVLKVKAGNGKGFKIEGDDKWFNATEKVMPYLAKIDVGTEVVVSYSEKGVKREVFKITVAKGTEGTSSSEKTSSTPTCKVCGKEMKNSKYDTCYTCGKGKTGKSKAKKSDTSNTYSDDRTANIQRGNALNAAAAVASNQTFADPEAAAEYTKMLADSLLEWLRAE